MFAEDAPIWTVRGGRKRRERRGSKTKTPAQKTKTVSDGSGAPGSTRCGPQERKTNSKAHEGPGGRKALEGSGFAGAVRGTTRRPKNKNKPQKSLEGEGRERKQEGANFLLVITESTDSRQAC